MKLATQVQILDEVICISLGVYAIGVGMNPSVLLPAVGK